MEPNQARILEAMDALVNRADANKQKGRSPRRCKSPPQGLAEAGA
jgi:hypothetical protein